MKKNAWLRIAVLAVLVLVPALAATPAVAAGSVNWGARYFEALKLYEEGRYPLAGERFALIAERAGDGFLKRRAALGALLSELAGAGTEDRFDAALGKWRAWVAEQGGGPLPIDPQMLDPIFRRAGLCALETEAANGEASRDAEDMAGEVERLREQIKALETLYQEFKRKEKIIE